MNKVKPEVIGFHLKGYMRNQFGGFYQRFGRGITFDPSKAHVFSKQELNCWDLTNPRHHEMKHRLRPVYRKHQRPEVIGYIVRSKSGYTYFLDFGEGSTCDRDLAHVFTKEELLSSKALCVRIPTFKRNYSLVPVYSRLM